jgi:Recombination endonuclease VII
MGHRYVKGCQCEGCAAKRARARKRPQAKVAGAADAVRIKTCERCGSSFTGNGYKYCSDECREKAHRDKKTAKQREYNARPGHQQTRIAQNRAWRLANPDRAWAHSLKCNHGMTPEQWFAMWLEQDGRCYLCQQSLPEDRARVAIDHDHRCCELGRSCGRCRRGLAHSACNSAIGLFLEDPALMRIVADNLERALHRTASVLARTPVQGSLFVVDVEESA